MRKNKNLRDLLQREDDSSLLYALETTPPELQAKVSLELGRRKVRAATEPLRKRLGAPLPALREAATEALGKIGDPSAGKDILALFTDRSQPDSIRDTCAYALGRLAYREALPELLSALADPAYSVRSCAVAALAAIGDANIRDTVEMVLETEQVPNVRESMKKLLASLDKQARPGTVSIVQYAFDPAQRVLNRSPEAMTASSWSYSAKERTHPELPQTIESQKGAQSQTVPIVISTTYVSGLNSEFPYHRQTQQHQL